MKPGTALERRLKKWGFKENGECKCTHYKVRMNNKGVQWCNNHMDLIIRWLERSAHQRKLPFSKIVARHFITQAIRDCENSPMETFFEEIYCVNLGRRPGRWKEFQSGVPKDWPFAEIKRFNAIDGRLCPSPAWWNQGNGAWGCYQSHLSIIQSCLNRGVDSVLLLEDDAFFCENFKEKVTKFLQAVPNNWGMIYLGGQHLKVSTPPKKVSDQVYIPYNVNRTHAFALSGQTMRAVYKHLNSHEWNKGHHVDHHLGKFVQNRKHPIFCPPEWFVGQRGFDSDISGRKDLTDRIWRPAEDIADTSYQNDPFVAVVGLHSSGTSATAGVLYHLGVHMGNKLIGFYGDNPKKKCGFEAVGLRDICEGAIPFPGVSFKWQRSQIYNRLKNWIDSKRQEAHKRGTIAGGKYPQLCRMFPQLTNSVGKNLKVVLVDRPVEISIESLTKRQQGKHSAAAIRQHQTWLAEGKAQFEELPEEQLFRVNYDRLVTSPTLVIHELASWLKLKVPANALQLAVESVHPEMRHFKGE